MRGCVLAWSIAVLAWLPHGVARLNANFDMLDTSVGNSPCAHSDDMLWERGIRRSATLDEAMSAINVLPDIPFKFFLHEGGDFDLSDWVRCYYDSVGGEDQLDLKVWPLDAEHATDVPLLRLLASHSRRSDDPAQAAIHVVGTPVNTAWLATNPNSTKSGKWCACGELPQLKERLDAVSDALHRLPEWRGQNQNSTFLFIDTDWRAPDAFGDKLVEDVRTEKAVVACADHVINDQFLKANSCVIIPYRAHYLLAENAAAFARSWEAESAQEQVNTAPDARVIPFTFHGNMVDRRTGAADRHLLEDLVEGFPAASVKAIDFKDMALDEYIVHGTETAQTMLNSTFCFVPAGDTPTTRRLFDALAAGCVPIIFDSIDDIADNLPFRNTINWGDIAIFLDRLTCIQDNMQAVKNWLAHLKSDDETLRRYERMRTLGRLVFAKYLDYKSEGMVDAMLRQFE